MWAISCDLYRAKVKPSATSICVPIPRSGLFLCAHFRKGVLTCSVLYSFSEAQPPSQAAPARRNRSARRLDRVLPAISPVTRFQLLGKGESTNSITVADTDSTASSYRACHRVLYKLLPELRRPVGRRAKGHRRALHIQYDLSPVLRQRGRDGNRRSLDGRRFYPGESQDVRQRQHRSTRLPRCLRWGRGHGFRSCGGHRSDHGRALCQ